MLASHVELSDQEARSALIARITARRKLLEAMAQWALSNDLEELSNDEEEDLKALAQLPGDNLIVSARRGCCWPIGNLRNGSRSVSWP